MRKLKVAVVVLIGFGMGALMPDRTAWAADSLLLNLLADRTATIPGARNTTSSTIC